MRREASPYEVRCARCDVSFPVETRSCLHCGGATGPAGQIELLEAMLESNVAPTQPMPESQPVPEFDPMAERSVRPEPIEPLPSHPLPLLLAPTPRCESQFVMWPICFVYGGSEAKELFYLLVGTPDLDFEVETSAPSEAV